MKHHKPSFPIRLLMQLLSCIVCLILILCLLCTVLVIDGKVFLCSDSREAIISDLLTGSSAQPQMATGNVIRLSSGPSVEPLSPGALLGDDDALAAYIQQMAEAYLDLQQPVTEAQAQEFLAQSTIKDFISEKASSYVSDVVTGEENATITADEIMDLVEENQALLEQTFQTTMTEENKQALREHMEQAVDEADFGGAIRQEITATLSQPIPGMDGWTLNDVMFLLSYLTQNRILLACIGLCLVLMLLLLALNFYNLPMGLTWAAIGYLIAGAPLSACVLMFQYGPTYAANAQIAQSIALVQTLAGAVAPVHHAVAIVGILLLAASLLWRVRIRKNK